MSHCTSFVSTIHPPRRPEMPNIDHHLSPFTQCTQAKLVYNAWEGLTCEEAIEKLATTDVNDGLLLPDPDNIARKEGFAKRATDDTAHIFTFVGLALFLHDNVKDVATRRAVWTHILLKFKGVYADKLTAPSLTVETCFNTDALPVDILTSASKWAEQFGRKPFLLSERRTISVLQVNTLVRKTTFPGHLRVNCCLQSRVRVRASH